jgi:hypothetical protein
LKCTPDRPIRNAGNHRAHSGKRLSAGRWLGPVAMPHEPVSSPDRVRHVVAENPPETRAKLARAALHNRPTGISGELCSPPREMPRIGIQEYGLGGAAISSAGTGN